jgi:hypothetical protein
MHSEQIKGAIGIALGIYLIVWGLRAKQFCFLRKWNAGVPLSCL